MAVNIRLAAPFAAIAGADEQEVSASTVRHALSQLVRQRAALGGRLLNCDGEVRGVVALALNGHPASLDDALRDGDTLEIAGR